MTWTDIIIYQDEWNRADEILKQLEDQKVGDIGQQVKQLSVPSDPRQQLSIFDAHTETFKTIRLLLESMDINRLTPVEALLKLQEIKSILK